MCLSHRVLVNDNLYHKFWFKSQRHVLRKNNTSFHVSFRFFFNKAIVSSTAIVYK